MLLSITAMCNLCGCGKNNNQEKVEAENLPIRLRIPRWSSLCMLSVNGVQVSAKKEGEYLVLERDFAINDEIVYKTPYNTVIENSDEQDVFTLRYGPYQMVSLERNSTEIVGNRESGWMANPTIYPDGEVYCLELDNGNKLSMQKYGLITNETFTTFFKRVDVSVR